MPPHVDYRLARRAVLSELDRGRLDRIDVCDAHPELLRAGRNVGEPVPGECPVCASQSLRNVSYVYGDALRQANGRCLTSTAELERLVAAHDEFAHYVVEVCVGCGWNHLQRRELRGRRHSTPLPPTRRRPSR